MTEVPGSDELETPSSRSPYIAAIVALIGLADSIYLTIHHLTAEPVPCSLVSGCETVLTSAYAEFAGIPIAAFGGAAYFTAFALAVYAAYGVRVAWMLFGALSSVMAGVSFWLLYLQAFVIGAYCQFCLVSAATSVILFLIAIFSRFWKRDV
ncbi:MAG TPA: vitamin K epoxide reductase family protein [Pyrinomonadaceae bacterium]|nr:vitamin K epoxide reductase family protein [Pyrinomonadaceae bacterium]